MNVFYCFFVFGMCGLVDHVRLKRELSAGFFSSRADSKWKSIFFNIYHVFEVVFLWKLKMTQFPDCLPYLFWNDTNTFENFLYLPPPFNKYYWNDSLNGIFDLWKETFPHETYILEKFITIWSKSFFFPPKAAFS